MKSGYTQVFLCSVHFFHECVLLCNFEVTDVKQQRICIKFCFKFGETVAETHKILQQSFGEEVLRHTHMYIRCFKNGSISTDDNKHSEQALTGTIPKNAKKVCEAILQDHRCDE